VATRAERKPVQVEHSSGLWMHASIVGSHRAARIGVETEGAAG